MAYCDYLFRRSNGIFYFRYVLKIQQEKPREIRISLKTRSYGSAKQLAASCFVKLNKLLRYMGRVGMNADELLKCLKVEMMKGVDPDNEEHKSRLEEVCSDIENKVLWVKKHVPEKFEGQSVKQVLSIYSDFAPTFNNVKSEINDNERIKIEEDIRKRAFEFYGIENKKEDNEQEVDNPKVSEVANLYCDEMLAGRNWREKTLNENMVSYKLFIELQGDISLKDVNIKNIAEFKTQLQRIPKNFRKLPVSRERQLAEIIRENHGLKTISISNVNKHLSKISTLLEWGRRNGYCSENIARGINIKQKVDPQEKRLPFKENELRQILSEIYSKKKYKHTYYFWLPLLALYNGGRISEYSQLDVSDIKEIEDIPCIDFNEEGDKQLKNLPSIRVIPIHSKLIEIGFLEFVKTVKKKNTKKLFYSIKKGRDGYGDAPSKWFGRIKNKKDLENPTKKTFHSFRHNFSDALKSENVPDPIAKQLTGHKDASITYGLYGSRSKLKQLQEFVEKVKYDIPEIENLKY